MYRSEEEIKKDMLNNIKNTEDKSQNSLVHDAISPASIEIAHFNLLLEAVQGKLDVENLFDDELERFVNQRTGMERKPATKATTTVTIYGQEGTKIKKGDLVGSDTVNFIILENKTIGTTKKEDVLVECEESGIVGNVPKGAIKRFPITIPGLISVTNGETTVNGYEAETDAGLLERYYERIRTPSTSGNIHHYRNWAKEVPGVGDAKVIPLWAGNGTVKVVIVDSNKNPATTELVTKIHEYIEDVRPIGATLTTVSAIAKDISIKAKVSLAEGYRIQLVQDEFKNALEQYRKSTAFKDSYISYAAINNLLFNVSGVIDNSDLKLNNEMKNIALKDEEIPIFKNVELEVM